MINPWTQGAFPRSPWSVTIVLVFGTIALTIEKVLIAQSHSLHPYFFIDIGFFVAIVAVASLFLEWMLSLLKRTASAWLMVGIFGYFSLQTLLILWLSDSMPRVQVVLAEDLPNRFDWVAVILCLAIAAVLTWVVTKRSKED